MKLFIISLLACFTASANTVQSVYLQNSQLDAELKQEVIDAITKEYPCLNPYGLKEIETIVKMIQVDQGIKDYYYTTAFTGVMTYDYHPSTQNIVVESVHYDGSNPTIDWTEVLQVRGGYCD